MLKPLPLRYVNMTVEHPSPISCLAGLTAAADGGARVLVTLARSPASSAFPTGAATSAYGGSVPTRTRTPRPLRAPTRSARWRRRSRRLRCLGRQHAHFHRLGGTDQQCGADIYRTQSAKGSRDASVKVLAASYRHLLALPTPRTLASALSLTAAQVGGSFPDGIRCTAH